MDLSDALNHLEESCGKLQMLTEVQLQLYMLMLTMSYLVERMELSGFGPELTESFLFNSTVRINTFYYYLIDQKKDIVSL